MGKIGIMGGTFDPIHNGHLMLGKQALMEYELDKIWYMPSGHPPHKKKHRVTEPAVRLAMTEAALEHFKGFFCSDFEVKRNGNTYTAQTLKLLQNEYPQHEFYFIIGADSLYEIENWYEPEEVMSNTVILAAKREYDDKVRSMDDQIAYLTEKYGATIFQLHCQEMDVSSAQLRKMIAEGRSIKDYVPEAVMRYINTHGLYREAET